MYLRKVDPVAALGLAAVGLCLLTLAPLGWRVGLWQYGFGLYWIMPVSGFVAAAAVTLSVSTLVRSWSELCMRGRVMLFIALALGAALVYVPLQYLYTRITVPHIHDITTDTDNPPGFSAALLGRARLSVQIVSTIPARSSLHGYRRLPIPRWRQLRLHCPWRGRSMRPSRS